MTPKKRKSVEWHTLASPRPMKAGINKSKIKTTVIVFFDIKGLVHHEIVPHGTTINTKFYVEVLKRFKRRVYHDNAAAHIAL